MPSSAPALPDQRPASWRPPLLVKASVALHLGAGVAVAQSPALWPWVLGGVGLNHAFLIGTSLWPRSTWLGDNLLRLPAESAARGEISLTIDDGPDPAVTPQVLDLLDAHGSRATFFCIARQATRHPTLCREIVRRGHSIQNHTHRHSHAFSFLGMRGMAREIGMAQEVLADITGVRPTCFRAPAGLRNPLLAPVLQRLGLRLVSWTRRGFDTVQRDPQRVLARLSHDMKAGDILLLHDGNAARTARGDPVVLQVLPHLLETFGQRGLRAVTLPDALAPEHAA